MKNAEYIKAKIVKWLINRNLSFSSKKDSIGVEVLFSTNKRRADMLILSHDFHALEIKGDFDNLDKLKNQLEDYHKTFDKVSLVCTPKHYSRIIKFIKPSTGLIVFNNESFTIYRAAKNKIRLDKLSLLMFLNKNQLLHLSRVPDANELSTNEIRTFISKRVPIKTIRNYAYSLLRTRYDELFRLFLKDTGDNIVWDELKGLCGRISNLYT
jgi:hypothetical protein